MVCFHDWLDSRLAMHTLVSRMSRFELEPSAPTAFALTVALVVMNGAGVADADADADEADEAEDGAVNMALDDGENGKLAPNSG